MVILRLNALDGHVDSIKVPTRSFPVFFKIPLPQFYGIMNRE